MASPRLPFDVELNWGTAPAAVPVPPPAAGFLRLFVAVLVDLGFSALAFFSVVVGIGWAYELSFSGVQVAACAVLGVLLAGWVEVGCLWLFHKTVGMHLLQVRADKAPTLGRSVSVWLAVLVSAPLVGLPLVLGGAGSRPLEKLAGSRLRLDQPGAGV